MTKYKSKDDKFSALAVPGGKDECWNWRNVTGYGYLLWDRKNYLVHRVAYEFFVGSIPRGLVIDHLCENRSCYNPNHLEPKSRYANAKRGYKPSHPGSISLLDAGVCRSGKHSITSEADLYITDYSKTCLLCRREKSALQWSKDKVKISAQKKVKYYKDLETSRKKSRKQSMDWYLKNKEKINLARRKKLMV